jgi:guanylate kinase
MSKLLVVVSGPSSVGKRCIMEAVRLYCTLNLLPFPFAKVVLYNTRPMRANERDGGDYHYCYGEFLAVGDDKIRNNKNLLAGEKSDERLKSLAIRQTGDLFSFPVRDDLQGIDVSDIGEGVNFLEIHDQFFEAIRPKLKSLAIQTVRLFVAPFTRNEMKDRARRSRTDDASVITREMRKRIRGRRRLGLSQENEAEILKRTDSAIREIQDAFSSPARYDAIVVNPCGEAHPDWGTSNTLPTGAARLVVDTVCRIIEARF